MPEILRPLRMTEPYVASCSPRITRPSVDLPHPELSDQSECLALLQLKRDAADGAKSVAAKTTASANLECLVKIVDFQRERSILCVMCPNGGNDLASIVFSFTLSPGCGLLPKMTSHAMIVACRDQLRQHLDAGVSLTTQSAARMERAAAGLFAEIAHLTGNGIEFRAPPVDARKAGEQSSRIGVARIPKHLFHRALFHNPPAIHDGDPIGGVRDQT